RRHTGVPARGDERVRRVRRAGDHQCRGRSWRGRRRGLSLEQLHCGASVRAPGHPRVYRGGMLKIKRAYEEASSADGTRVLVDRLWPRGVTKERAAVDWWAKELAPSHELRK